MIQHSNLIQAIRQKGAIVTSLRSYDDWKYCIESLCKIPLTRGYVAQRLEELRDTNNFTTRKFARTWGDEHRMQVITWFERAQSELAGTGH